MRKNDAKTGLRMTPALAVRISAVRISAVPRRWIADVRRLCRSRFEQELLRRLGQGRARVEGRGARGERLGSEGRFFWKRVSFFEKKLIAANSP
jgi:hypothetical protein